MKKVLVALALSSLFSTPSFGETVIVAPPGDTTTTWSIYHAGVCRDSQGQYPKWSEYEWTLEQCETNCSKNQNCRAFAMAKDKNYCQLFGSDGSNPASPAYKEGTEIDHGDSQYSGYTCLRKGCDGWKIYHAGVCRDSQGQHPRWSEYKWTLEQCETNCSKNQNCKAFAMAKDKNYCQLFGSDGSNPASPAYKEGTEIDHGDSQYSGYTCFIKDYSCIK